MLVFKIVLIVMVFLYIINKYSINREIRYLYCTECGGGLKVISVMDEPYGSLLGYKCRCRECKKELYIEFDHQINEFKIKNATT